MIGMGRDFQQAMRSLAQRPGFAATVVLTLGLGVGVSTAVFSVVNAVLLRPLPYREADRLVALFTDETRKGQERNPTSPADFLAWKRQSRSLADMTAAHPWSPVLSGRGQPEPIPGLKATAGLFALLRAEAAHGQVWDEASALGSGEDVVVLSHRLWQRRFGADPHLVGQTLTLDGKPYVVAGVMPPAFRFPPFWSVGAEMWTPLRMTARDETNTDHFLRVFARLRPGAALEQARSEMDLVGRRLVETEPKDHAGIEVNVEALQEPVVSRIRPALLGLLGAVGFVLLIAGANVMSLLMARGLGREKEVVLRAALGAGRLRLLSLLLSETMALSLLGGLLGIGLAAFGVEALRVLGPADLPRLAEIRLDARVLGFGLLLSLVTGLLSGLAPAWAALGTDLAASLKRGERAPGLGRHPLHDALVVAQFALAVVLLVGAGLLTKSFLRLLHPEPGFRTQGLLTLSISLSGSPFAEPDRQSVFFERVLEGAHRVPGVVHAALVNLLPVAGDTWGTRFSVEGQTAPADDPASATFRVASPGYLETMGIPLLQGRTFTADDRSDTPRVVLVNRTLARRHWPGGDGVGQRIRQGGPDSTEPWLTVVGVTGDACQSSLTEPIGAEIVFPYTQNPVAWHQATTLLVETRTDPLALADALKREVWSIAPDLPVTPVQTMQQVLTDAVSEERFSALLLGWFALCALALAAIGMYGVMAYVVRARAREIGIRMALGARAGAVFAGVVGRGLALSGLGAALGLAGALAATRVFSAWLFGVSPKDPAVFLGVLLVLLLASLLACALPARRAALVDPLVALRDE
jgi:putative ABC transport system permease protein